VCTTAGAPSSSISDFFRAVMKKFISLFVFLFLSSSLYAQSAPQPPALDVKSYVLLDFESGTVLASKEPHLRVEPASLTKIMTTYVAFDELQHGRVSMDDQVLISEKAWRSEGSRSFIEVGKRVRFEDLLHGSIIQSGNDASIAIAEHIAGDESVFVQLMNKHAKRLGMVDTQFSNATGLPSPELYTSAYDMALLSQALIRDFPDLYPWFKDQEFTYNNIRQYNRNQLLDLDPTADGIKTGHTNAAGYCLAGSAIRDGRRLITVMMSAKGSRERAQMTKGLLDYGFRFFETARLFGVQKPVATVRAWKGAVTELPVGVAEPVALALPRGSSDRLQISHQIEGPVLAPIRAGQVLGTVTVSLNGEVLRTQPLVSLQSVEAGSLWQRASDTVRMFLQD
jgi:serine-type D-Ala-D-Ala carboxypeptidase (penicillin-binding protein 5/6)